MQKLKLCTFLCSELERVGIFTKTRGGNILLYLLAFKILLFSSLRKHGILSTRSCALPFSLPLPAHTQSLLLICKKGKLLFFTNYFNKFKATRKSDFYK